MSRHNQNPQKRVLIPHHKTVTLAARVGYWHATKRDVSPASSFEDFVVFPVIDTFRFLPSFKNPLFTHAVKGGSGSFRTNGVVVEAAGPVIVRHKMAGLLMQLLTNLASSQHEVLGDMAELEDRVGMHDLVMDYVSALLAEFSMKFPGEEDVAAVCSAPLKFIIKAIDGHTTKVVGKMTFGLTVVYDDGGLKVIPSGPSSFDSAPWVRSDTNPYVMEIPGDIHSLEMDRHQSERFMLLGPRLPTQDTNSRVPKEILLTDYTDISSSQWTDIFAHPTALNQLLTCRHYDMRNVCMVRQEES